MRAIVPHLVAVIAIALCVRLALWQLDRADEKQQLLSQWETAAELSHQALDTNPAPFSRVRLLGRFDEQRTVFLDNQVRQNHPGVHVFSPFLLDEGERIVLINRGWQPWSRRSGEWPMFETPAELVEITGRLSEPPRVGFQLGEEPPLNTEQWPNLMTYFDMARLRDAFGAQLFLDIVLLDPDHSAHLSGDDWAPVNMGPEKHFGYAFQWASIGTAILVIWLSLTLRNARRKTS